MKVTRHFIDAKYGQLHLRVAGLTPFWDPSRVAQADAHSVSELGNNEGVANAQKERTAIICLHMIPKSSKGFVKLMPELAQLYPVIAPDYPGYGESDSFALGAHPTVLDYADSIEQVINHFAITQVLLVGYHTGSMVAAELAHRHPQLVKKLVMMSTPIFSADEAQELKAYFSPIPLDKAGTRYQVMWNRIMKYAGPGQTLEMAAASMAENLRGGERYEEGHMAAFNYAASYVSRLQSIEQPTWVVNLGDDLFENTKRVDNYLRNGTRTDFPQYGHGCLEVAAKQLGQHMVQFFKQ